MPAGTTYARLVDEFAAAMYRHGVAVDRQAVEQEMRERIGEIAKRLRVDPQTVLRDHAHDGWARQMSDEVIRQIRQEGLLDAGTPARPSV